MSINSRGSRLSPKQAVAGVVILTIILIGNGAVAVTAAVQTHHLFVAVSLVTLLLVALVLLVRGGRMLLRNAVPGES
ncbi:MAG: hypothetical protein HY067_14175 [Betaproteobacteria bacterium]|nr:hypothetical protein [Betaproteobacteria bacterium]